jgi:hypothetical protein
VSAYAARPTDDAYVEVDVCDMEPYAPHTALVVPFMGSGFRLVGGLPFYLSYNDALYPMCARVLKVHPTCTMVAPGDVVYLKDVYCYDDITRIDGRRLAVLDERCAVGRVKGFDTDPVAV